MIRIDKMFFILIQILFVFYCQAIDLYEGHSIEFTSKNFSNALKQLPIKTIPYCNRSITNSFYNGEGMINIRCYNETDNRKKTSLQFDIIITNENKRFSYDSRAHHVCLFNSLCDGTFINDWIQWQIIAINKTIQAENAIKKESIKLQIWGLFDHNKANLCFNISVNQNKTLNPDPNDNKSNVSEILDKTTEKCLGYKDNYTNIINNISLLIIELIDLIKPQRSVNDKNIIFEETTKVSDIPSIEGFKSLLINTNQSTIQKNDYKKNRSKILIFVISIVVALILLVIFSLIYCTKHRQGYRPAATL
jgi:hypothetical protein